MRFTFTPATERALVIASDWCNRTGRLELDAESLLVGLLSESECRAAVILAKHGVDIRAVCQQWPTLEQSFFAKPALNGGDVRRIPFSTDVECSLQAVRDRLDFLPRQPELATEHALLGLVSADHEVAVWLRQRGLNADAIEAEIRKLHGYEMTNTAESLAVDDTSSLADDSTSSLAPDGTSAKEPDQTAVPAAAKQCEIFVPATDAKRLSSNDLLRILDAAANRAREGLRVIEDFTRFVLDDRHLTELCKQLRHDLTAALSQISPESRMAARETQEDVGTVLTTSAEQHRDDFSGVVRANFARLEESLRSLEEFGKMGDVGMAESFKQLRYRTYTLERAVEITRGSIERLDSAKLYVLVDGCDSPEDFERLVHSLIEVGVHVIQLRDKRLDDRELLARARMLRAMTRGTQTLCIVNDRPDLAALADADGVHVGQEEVSVKDARRIVGPDALVGVSTHSIEQARQAVLDGANYIGVGPTFPSGTKQFEHFPGVELLRAVAAEIRLPAFAIGGIRRENVNEVLATGFSRIAVSGAVAAADDPQLAARELLEILGKNHGGTEGTEISKK